VDLAQIRIFHIIPGEAGGSSMVFSRRDVGQIRLAGVRTQTFFLRSRTNPFLIVSEWLRLRKELKLFRPHIVHAHYGTMTGCIAVFCTTAPTVVTFHSSEFNHELDVPWFREKAGRVLSRIAAARASRIICVADEFKRQLSWCSDKVHVIPSSVDLERFHPQLREEAREELGWNEDQDIVLFYKGHNPVTKRLDRALATIERARQIHGPIRLEILDGSVDPDRIPLFLNAADCLLCTSDSEGSPTIVKEAMACNLPIVSVDVGDVRQRLTHVENCFVLARDPEVLAHALAEVLRSRQRSNGRMHLSDVTSSFCRDRYLDVYRDLLPNR
jgi:glycosyltransferase involved in cell wall biosynthesis